jgi:capsular polysaccharide biosynthesis protein
MASPLQSTVRENVSVGALSYDRIAPVRYVVGAWLDDGSVVEEMLLHRGRKKPSKPSRHVADAHVAGDVIYGGILIHHYGHFLFETLSRYWFLKHKPRRAVWHVLPEAPELATWQKEIFSMLRLEVDRSDLILQPTRFEKLTIPQAGAELWTSLHPDQVDAMGIFPFREPIVGRKVWLSRSLLKRGAVEEEHRLEALLERTGWEIVRPETLPVMEQLRLLRDAEIVAGFDGSAFHTLLLGRDVRARLVIVPRGGTDKISATYDVIAKAKGLTQSVLPARILPVRGSGRGAMHRLDRPRELAEALNSI